MDYDEIEKEIQDKILLGPCVTPADIEANISSEHYFTAAEGVIGSIDDESKPLTHHPESLDRLVFCVLVLKNGFTVTGESACVSPENFDWYVGCTIARQNAIEKIWPLMGYELKQRLAVKK